MDNWVNTWTPDAPWTKDDHNYSDCRFSCNVSIDDEWHVGCAHSLLTGGVDVVETTDDNFCEMWEDEALREGFGGAIAHGKNPVGEGWQVMNEKKRARLVKRRANDSGGTYEVWDVGNECGIYVDFNPCTFLPSRPETIAFQYDLESNTVTSWRGIGTWYEDATGGKAIRVLGYEPIEEGNDDEH